ncbi:hypothetical protein SDRG_16746 [Saprolegnia diclina VS20]|uniref:F-box domain-containing protein n=1 Tax=Saprolegnia diclina (strain VS20) TaxID=1156394 RepID=T0R085_SAPDV|nr:hypothetical protein SDRG_16746 [Saprolegnia diclina VS20]EQC25383.1 hypothetical protein SDRG_16746 [Saprolegnia diclina VS20]|eukprot:XP_008621185.1 hypothetical protein SDRG_16746 [Saprolegnia diclina VS20]
MESAVEAYVRGRAGAAVDDIVVVMTVQSVLEEMVNDVEVWDLEVERSHMAKEMHRCKALLAQSAVRERVEWDEKQKMVQQMHAFRLQGKALATKLMTQVEHVALDAARHEALERELDEANEKLASMGSLTRELARAQREIRDLHRKQGIHNLLHAAPARHRVSAARVASDALANCPDKVVMGVFAYLTAHDVLRVSMTGQVWKTRVSVLFGVQAPMAPKVTPPPTPIRRKPSSVFDKTQLAKADEILQSLSNREVKFFRDLMLRMKQLEASLTQVEVEKEDIGARLHGAEKVRDFLMDKLKDLEEALATSMEETAKAGAQSSLDREVLAYLDVKVQELEDELSVHVAQTDEYRAELERVQRQHSAKTQVLDDMLRHVTAEKRDLDLQAKSQKKVLVKEVRMLRAENARLQAESRGYRLQLTQLKESLLQLDQFDAPVLG